MKVVQRALIKTAQKLLHACHVQPTRFHLKTVLQWSTVSATTGILAPTAALALRVQKANTNPQMALQPVETAVLAHMLTQQGKALAMLAPPMLRLRWKRVMHSRTAYAMTATLVPGDVSQPSCLPLLASQIQLVARLARLAAAVALVLQACRYGLATSRALH